ncbi:MAG: hypothetical protein WCK63_14425 [Betaproteobacteria bacterium]
MATNRNKPAAKKQPAATNKPAPAKSEIPAGETGKGAAPAALESNTQATGSAATQSDATKVTPPGGGSTPQPKSKDGAVKSLMVSAKVEGFRRAGRAWSKASTTVSADEFSVDQLTALMSEPMLDVVAVEEYPRLRFRCKRFNTQRLQERESSWSYVHSTGWHLLTSSRLRLG